MPRGDISPNIEDFPSDDEKQKAEVKGSNPYPSDENNKKHDEDPQSSQHGDVDEEDVDDEFSGEQGRKNKVEGAPSTRYIFQALRDRDVPDLTQDDAGIEAYHLILVKDMLHMTGDFFNICSQ